MFIAAGGLFGVCRRHAGLFIAAGDSSASVDIVPGSVGCCFHTCRHDIAEVKYKNVTLINMLHVMKYSSHQV